MAAYGWPGRFLEAPRAYEGEKGVRAAEIEVGRHTLALTRLKTGATGRMLVEIDPAGMVPSGDGSPAIAVSDDFHGLADPLCGRRVGVFIRALSLANAGADDRPRAIEPTGASAPLFEAAGHHVDSIAPDTMKQPGLSTGLPHQFVSNNRS